MRQWNFFHLNGRTAECFRNKTLDIEPENCETAFHDKEKLHLWGDKVGSCNNPPHVLICSNIGLIFLCNLQILFSCW